MLSASGRGRPKTKGPQYVPSYMESSNGSPEPCVVCGDAATGYHYRCMTCEGCKGFFRRTIQKQLRYVCKGEDNCNVDKTSRNACQQCRYRKCVAVGMATDLVLNNTQRLAKRQLIEDNRDRRKVEAIRAQIKAERTVDHMSTEESDLVRTITAVYYSTLENSDEEESMGEDRKPQINVGGIVLQPRLDTITQAVKRIIEFAEKIPFFSNLDQAEQQHLLRGAWIELTLLKIVRKFDSDTQRLTMPSGRRVSSTCLIDNDGRRSDDPAAIMTKLIYELASSVGRLELDDVETSIMAALLLFYPDRALAKSSIIERAQDRLLSALKHYVIDTFPGESIRWPKLLMKLTDIRATGARLFQYCNENQSTSTLAELFGQQFAQ